MRNVGMKMRILGVKNLMAKILVFSLFIYFYAGAENISSDVVDVEDVGQAPTVNPVRALEDQTERDKMKEFFDSITENFSKINERMADLERVGTKRHEELKKVMASDIIPRISALESEGLRKREKLKEEILADINPRISALETLRPRTRRELKEETASEQVYWNKLQNDYQTGMYDVLTFLEKMNQRFIGLETVVSLLLDSTAELKTENFADYLAPPTSLVELTDCGGNLELVRGSPSTIRYQNGGKNQSCAWNVSPQVKFDSYRMKFQLLGSEPAADGIRVYYTNSSSELQSKTITEFGSWIPIPAPHVLITFCANPSKVSLGFEASVLGFGISEDSANFKPSWFGNSTENSEFLLSENFADCIAAQTPLVNSTACGGNLEVARGVPSAIRYPNPGNNEGCAWSIDPKVKFDSYRVKFQSLGTDAAANGLTVYFGNSVEDLKPRLITEFGSWISIPASFVFITFYSNPTKVRRGFEASILGFGISSDAANFNKPSWFGNSVKTLEFFVNRIASLTPLMTSTDCGGILKVGRGVPSTIRYPKAGNYTFDEHCTWTIDPQFKFAAYRIKVQSFGISDGCDGVAIYFWNDNAELQSKKITDFGSWIDIPATYVLITFCSVGRGGQGFGASIVGVGASLHSSTFRPFWLTNYSASFSYPPETSSTELNNEMVSVVVRPPHDAAVSVSVPQVGDDTIKPYELRCDHCEALDYELIERSDGGSSSSATYAFDLYSSRLFLLIFESNALKSGVRFTISY